MELSQSSYEKALLCSQAALDKKAENLKILNVSEISGFTDCFVICSAQSDRQVEAIAKHMEATLAEHGLKPLSAEGLREGRWVLMDFGDVVAHIFLEPLRDYYQLETLWAKAIPIQIPQELYVASHPEQ